MIKIFLITFSRLKSFDNFYIIFIILCIKFFFLSPIFSNELVIESEFQSSINNRGYVIAEGDVLFSHNNFGIKAKSKNATYNTREEIIVLSGEVDVIQKNGNRLIADRVTYFINEQRIVALPLINQQVFSFWRLGNKKYFSQ